MTEHKRDDRDFDVTQLHLDAHGKSLHRDYTAHFFRWSFARRFIRNTDNLLDIGCGTELPLIKPLLGSGPANNVNKYVGVDLNKLKPSKSSRVDLRPEFDFTSRYTEILADYPEKFDRIFCFEVIEHMLPAHGKNLLRGIKECLKPEGLFFISTPCYDGHRHAKNHIHEYTVDELREYLVEAGFEVVDRFGTFMDVREITRNDPQRCRSEAVHEVWNALSKYYDNNALSCFFAPLFPDYARNNIWICKLKSEQMAENESPI